MCNMTNDEYIIFQPKFHLYMATDVMKYPSHIAYI